MDASPAAEAQPGAPDAETGSSHSHVLFANAAESLEELSLYPKQAVKMLDNFYAADVSGATSTPSAGAARRAKPRVSAAASRPAASVPSSSAKAEPSRLTRALMAASARGDVRACCSFLQQGAQLTAPKPGAAAPHFSQAAIFEAVRHGHAAVVQLLCTHEANPMLQLEPGTQTGKKMSGCMHNHIRLATVDKNVFASTALEAAIEGKQWDVVSTLLLFLDAQPEARQAALAAAVGKEDF
jgi:hypothetical protein